MIVNNSTSLGILTALNQSVEAQNKSLEKVASGKQINSASDDPTGLAITMALESVFRSLNGQIANRQGELSLLQTAEGGLASGNDILQRMGELSVQAANGTLTDGDRQMIQQEIGQLNQQLDLNANNTQYNTKSLLDGSLNLQLQNGQTFTVPASGASALGTNNIDVTTQTGAQAAIGRTAHAIETVTGARSTIGAASNGISSDIANLQNQYTQAAANLSRIADADIAQEMVNLTNAQIMNTAQLRVFQTDQALRQSVLQLLG